MNRLKTVILSCFLSFASLSIFGQDGKTFQHTIEQGETVYAIATMYGVSTEAIYKLNPGSKEGIKAGEVLLIPQKKASASGNRTEAYTFHTIQPKETLYAVSMKYKVPAQYILEANPGLSVKTFQKGRTIRIPSGDSFQALAAQTPDNQPTEEAPVSEITYTIQKKETMYSLCRKFKVSSYELLKLNPQLKSGVKAGMEIKVPAKGETASNKTENNASSESFIQSESEVNALLSAPKTTRALNQLKVALLLPFNPSKKTAASSRFIEYYEGMLLAVDSLQKQGLSLDLSVYDTGEGTSRIREILTGETLPNADLIIGAVQNDQIKMIADFAQEHRIKYVIPFTSKNDDVLSNNFVFQVNTPHSYLYSKAAERGRKLFANDNIVFVNIHDKEEKKPFIKALQNELKDHQVPFKEIEYNGETFAQDLDSLYMADQMRNIIIPTSSSLEALQKVKTPLRMLAETQTDYTISLFGYPEWQTYVREALDDFYALDTYIYTNFYADNLSRPMQDFYNKFKTWYSKDLINTYPKYGILGFDTGMFFFGAMKKYGVNFEEELDNIHYPSIQTGFDFHRVNNWGGFINTQIFIVHYNRDFTVTRE